MGARSTNLAAHASALASGDRIILNDKEADVVLTVPPTWAHGEVDLTVRYTRTGATARAQIPRTRMIPVVRFAR